MKCLMKLMVQLLEYEVKWAISKEVWQGFKILEYENIKNKNTYQKDFFIDTLYNELVISDSKLKRMIRKYK